MDIQNLISRVLDGGGPNDIIEGESPAKVLNEKDNLYINKRYKKSYVRNNKFLQKFLGGISLIAWGVFSKGLDDSDISNDNIDYMIKKASGMVSFDAEKVRKEVEKIRDNWDFD